MTALNFWIAMAVAVGLPVVAEMVTARHGTVARACLFGWPRITWAAKTFSMFLSTMCFVGLTIVVVWGERTALFCWFTTEWVGRVCFVGAAETFRFTFLVAKCVRLAIVTKMWAAFL